MSIRRWTSSKDTTITNSFRSDLKTRMTGANMGASDVLEVFSIYAQSSSISSEKSRVLLQFSTTQIATDRTNGKIAASGSVNFYLRLFNAAHGETLPRNFTLMVSAITKSFEEGTGMDMEEGLDITRNSTGANWLYASSGSLWQTQGGDYLSASASQSFDGGTEDMEVDITSLTESWINGGLTNNGMIIYLSSSQEDENRSYFTKRFFSRSSEYFFKKPIIEARWDSSTKDDRHNFSVSSSLLNLTDNTHTIYLYNYF